MWRKSGRGCTVMPPQPASMHTRAAVHTSGSPSPRALRNTATLLRLTLSTVTERSRPSGTGTLPHQHGQPANPRLQARSYKNPKPKKMARIKRCVPDSKEEIPIHVPVCLFTVGREPTPVPTPVREKSSRPREIAIHRGKATDPPRRSAPRQRADHGRVRRQRHALPLVRPAHLATKPQRPDRAVAHGKLHALQPVGQAAPMRLQNGLLGRPQAQKRVVAIDRRQLLQRGMLALGKKPPCQLQDTRPRAALFDVHARSEEHTSE